MSFAAMRRAASLPSNSLNHLRSDTPMRFSGTGGSAKHSISRERFVTLTVRYERRVRVFVSTLHPKRSDVDEILQDAWLVAWKKLDTFRYSGEQPDEEFVRWLCTIARYEVNEYRRKNATRLLLDEKVIEKLTALQFDEADYLETRHEALLKCIENLRPRDKELIPQAVSRGYTGAGPGGLDRPLDRHRLQVT